MIGLRFNDVNMSAKIIPFDFDKNSDWTRDGKRFERICFPVREDLSCLARIRIRPSNLASHAFKTDFSNYGLRESMHIETRLGKMTGGGSERHTVSRFSFLSGNQNRLF